MCIRDSNTNVLHGDVDLNGVVDFLDISPFVNVLVNNQFQLEADVNKDGLVNLQDIGPFIDILTAG